MKTSMTSINQGINKLWIRYKSAQTDSYIPHNVFAESIRNLTCFYLQVFLLLDTAYYTNNYMYMFLMLYKDGIRYRITYHATSEEEAVFIHIYLISILQNLYTHLEREQQLVSFKQTSAGIPLKKTITLIINNNWKT